MILVDTHCHLDFDDFKADLEEVIGRAEKSGVERIINIGSTVESSEKSAELASKYPAIYATLGVHPHHAGDVTDGTLKKIKDLAGKNKKVVAIGEIGLDYAKSRSSKEDQKKAFRQFIGLARELGLPLVIHNRDASSDLLDILKKEAGRHVSGVMHCFSGDGSFLKEVLDLGLFVSFTCNLTFKNAAALRKLAERVPLERLLIETDSPFLAPQSRRGKRNEPSYITQLVDTLSEIRRHSKEDIARITTHNANALFKLGLAEKPAIAYDIKDSIYLNLTNRCTNECDFCARFKSPFVKGHNLRLEKEPSAAELLGAIKAFGDPARFKEIVFCGFGEPTLRLDIIKEVSSKIKEIGKPVRLVTNGHGDLINGRLVLKELKGLVDRLSVSLNVDTKEKYNRVCRPDFGPDTYDRVKDFIKEAVKLGFKVEATCLDLPEADIDRCRDIVGELGAEYRQRMLNAVG